MKMNNLYKGILLVVVFFSGLFIYGLFFAPEKTSAILFPKQKKEIEVNKIAIATLMQGYKSIARERDSLAALPRNIGYKKAKVKLLEKYYNDTVYVSDTTIISTCYDYSIIYDECLNTNDSIYNALDICQLEKINVSLENDTLIKTIAIKDKTIKQLMFDKKFVVIGSGVLILTALLL